MKNRFRKIYPILIVLLAISALITIITIKNSKGLASAEPINIEEVLKSEAYVDLPNKAKNYIREVYKEEGTVLLTENNKQENEEYLNPAYIDYLNNSEGYSTIPSIMVVDFVPGTFEVAEDLPESFDLTNVDGKNYITPWKNQGSEGLCWDFAANATLESYLLYTNNQEYTSSAIILSEQQIDYATATDGVDYENYLYANDRELSSGGFFETVENVLVDGLGTVPSSWDSAHSSQINNKSTIERADIYNFNNSLFELNSTIHVPTIDVTSVSSEVRQEYIDSIKTNIMLYGGAWVSTDMYAGNYNRISGERIKVVNHRKGHDPFMHGYHALEIIGWDDNITYYTCNRNFNGDAPSDCPNDYVTGQGVWILKNSWGNNGRIVYLAYDSYETDIFFIKELAEKNWDNFYKTERNATDNKTIFFSFQENAYVNNEKLKKIKIDLPQNTTNKITYSTDKGSTYKTLGTITTTFEGFYYLDVESKNITVDNTLILKVVTDAGKASKIKDFRIYTKNQNTTKSAVTEDIEYDVTNEKLNPSKYFEFGLYTQTKNIDNSTPLTIKIKKDNGEYVSPNYYTYEYNLVYANINYGKLTIDSEHINKGHYTIETYYDGNNYTTADFDIAVDLIITQGDGSSENPWQITNTRQFNTIRNYPNDSFILMNDIDFEYDTRNPNGLFYNEGFGFEAIQEFRGFLNGNGHQIKNLYSKSEINTNNNTEIRKGGIIDDIFIYQCELENCGIKNIIIYNPEIIGGYSTGGFINEFYVELTPNLVIEDISVVSGSVSSVEQPTYNLGGIIGALYYYVEEGNSITIKNLYNSARVEGHSNKNKNFKEYIGGVIGSLCGDGDQGNITIENVMNAGKVVHSTYYESLGNITNIVGGTSHNVELTNLIALYEDVPAIGINSEIDDYSVELTIAIKNLYTTSSEAYELNAEEVQATANNIQTNLTAYEIANANYSDWEDFSTNWNQSNLNNVKRIPILKNVSFNYTDIDSELTLQATSTANLQNIINNYTSDDYIEVFASCNYQLDVCENVTDETIISISNTQVTGLKAGNTTVIIGNRRDGYINAINVEVTPADEITFNANGGEGEMEPQQFVAGSQVTLTTNTFRRTNYSFDHWNTAADDSGTSYTNGQTTILNNSIELFAIWTKDFFTITFDANDGEGEMDPQTIPNGRTDNLTANTFNKQYFHFVHWNTAADDSGTSYTDTQSITPTEDITLYAIWAENGPESVHLNVDDMHETYVGAPGQEKKFYTELSANKKARVYLTKFSVLNAYGLTINICDEAEDQCFNVTGRSSIKYDSERAQNYYEFTPNKSSIYNVQLEVNITRKIEYTIGIYQDDTINENVINVINNINESAPVENPPVYRLYNPVLLEHLYTTDANEAKVLYKDHGWGFEGVGWYSSTEGTPVYRLYNPGLSNHLYTSDENEVEILTSQHGWVKDNDGQPVMYSTGNDGNVPIFRVYNESMNGMHHLTTDENEYNTLPEYGWQQEGISMYGAMDGKPRATDYYYVDF